MSSRATERTRHSTQRRSLGLTSRDSLSGPVVLLLGAAVLFLIGWGIIAAVKSTNRSVTTKVTDKERVCDASGETGRVRCRYLIFTEAGTFKVTDSLIYGNFRSSDVYGQIARDACYIFEVHGWRVPWSSEYPNIHHIQRIDCS